MTNINFWKSVAAGWIRVDSTPLDGGDPIIPEDDEDFDYNENFEGADDELDE